MTADPSLAHLMARVHALEALVHRAVDRRRSADPAPDDPFRGLYLSDEHVDQLLNHTPAPRTADPTYVAALVTIESAADTTDARLRLRSTAAAFRLDQIEVELLLVAMAPDVEPRFERFYGYLNDDVSRRRATIGLALELSGGEAASATDRARVARLAELGLLLVEEADGPYLSRSLRVPDRVTAHLLGDDRIDAALEPFTVRMPLATPLPVSTGARLVYLREPISGIARSRIAAARCAIVLDAERMSHPDDAAELARIAAREAILIGAALVVGPVEVLADRGAAAVRAFADRSCQVFMTGRDCWDPAWSEEVPLVVDVTEPGTDERRAAWQGSLNGTPLDGVAETAQFRLSPEQVGRAARAALLQAAYDGTPVTAGHLRAGARGQNAAGLDRLACRVEPNVTWGDLVLPPRQLADLHELTGRARHRQLVLEGWRMRPGGRRGRGVSALFAGDSGTGKTLAAEVVAADLGLDLYIVNLATVVDKYVGETEKNLERIFSEAANVNGVLLFDEADAVFGKRSEVRDAHDRYANVETAYLLQRMENFDGIALLTSNLRVNVDEAFTRRLDAVVDFPMPDEEHRLLLWDRCLGSQLPRADDLDLDFCARSFELSGGSIRSVTLTAAYFAATASRPVEMADLIQAVHREYLKLGRLSVAAEFGRYHALLSAR